MPTSKKTAEKSVKKAPKASKSPKVKTSKKGAVQEASGAFAIIETGGKQSRVAVGDTIKIEKINDLKIGDAVSFDKVLLIAGADQNLELSVRNLKGVRMLRTEGLNCYDILKHDWLVMTQDAVKAIESRLGVEK